MGRKVSFPQPSQELDMLPGFLSQGAGVEGAGEVLHQVHAMEFGSLDYLPRGSIDVQWRMVTLRSLEVNEP